MHSGLVAYDLQYDFPEKISWNVRKLTATLVNQGCFIEEGELFRSVHLTCTSHQLNGAIINYL